MKIYIIIILSLILNLPEKANCDTIDKETVSTTQGDTLPMPPAFLRCGDGKLGYGLYWIDQSKNEVKFKIYRAVNSIDNFTAYSEIKSKTSATTGTECYCKIDYNPENFYSCKVSSISKAGESNPSNIAIIPKRPIGFSGQSDSISVTLDWAYPADHMIQLIFVERSKNPDSLFKILAPIVSQNGVKFIDYSPEKGVDYYYRIRGAYYQSKTRVTCYTMPTMTMGPFRIPGAGKDYDGELAFQGRTYKFKAFGNQTWMIENLAYLPEVYPSNMTSVTEKRYYVYGYQGSNVTEAQKADNYSTYGVLYNGLAANNGIAGNSSEPLGVQGICPSGWHLPSNMEWLDLSISLNGIRAARDSTIRADAIRKGIKPVQNSQFDGDFAMPDFREFNALPAGYVSVDSNRFLAIGEAGNFWSSTSRIVTERGFNAVNSDKGSGYSVRCLKGAAFPSVSTAAVDAITETTAAVGGILLQDGGAPIISRGVCWGNLETPTIDGNKESVEPKSGPFECSLTDLIPGTIYFLRAFATNSTGTAYGKQVQFTTRGEATLPVVTTGDISDITGSSAAVGGNLAAYGGTEVTARGVCWNTKKAPTISDNRVVDEYGKQSFTGYLPELRAHTIYYVRVFATNSKGTAYGKEKQFTTGDKGEGGTFDYFGRTYTYETIGTQTWMTENLAYLPSVNPPTAGSMNAPYYYVYGYEGNNADSATAYSFYKRYGVLYNWIAAKTACPSGWHLPSSGEIVQLTDYLTNYGYGFGKSGKDIAKSMTATTGWDSLDIPGSVGYDQILNNRSRFNALPAGQRTVPRNGMISNIRKAATFWTTSEFKMETSLAYALVLFYSHEVVNPFPNADKRNGYSVRCLKDK